MRRELKKVLLEVGYNLYEAVKWGWRPYVILFLTLPTFLHAQTERAQKQAKVIEQRQGSQTTPNYNYNANQNYNRGYTDGFIDARTPYYYNPMVWGYTPYWNPNRRWDNRDYIITMDNSKISPMPPLRISIGLLGEVTTQTPTLNPYLIIGQHHFLIFELGFGGRNSYPYYDNIYTWEVEEWEDRYIGTNQRRMEAIVGFGTTIKRYSPFVGIGFPSVTTWDVYEDETFTLSTPRDLGYYSINEDIDNRTNLKLGLIYGWEKIEGIIQLSSFEGLSFGDGLRLGLGVGIKL